MNTKSLVIVVTILGLLSIAAGAALFPVFTEPMATHWDAAGQANGFGSRFTGLLLLPLLATCLSLLMAGLPTIDPLKANIALFRREYNGLVLVFFGFMLYVYTLTLAWNAGFRYPMTGLMAPAFAVLMFFIGQLLGKAKRNFFIGIRTPWTLSSDEVWRKTHQLGAMLFKASAVISLVGLLFPAAAFVLILAPVLVSSATLVVYSWSAYRSEERSGT